MMKMMIIFKKGSVLIQNIKFSGRIDTVLYMVVIDKKIIISYHLLLLFIVLSFTIEFFIIYYNLTIDIDFHNPASL